MFDETKLPAAAAEATIGALQELAKQGGVNAGRPHGEAAKVGEALVQTAAAVAPVAVAKVSAGTAAAMAAGSAAAAAVAPFAVAAVAGYGGLSPRPLDQQQVTTEAGPVITGSVFKPRTKHVATARYRLLRSLREALRHGSDISSICVQVALI